MKGKPTVPSVQSALRVTPKRWRCTTCHRVNDTRSPDPVCGHVPPWVEADRAAEADLARFRSAEQTRMADRWHRERAAAARGHLRLTPDLITHIRQATGAVEAVARQFGVSTTTVKNIRRNPAHGQQCMVWTEAKKAEVRAMPGSDAAVARHLGVARSTISAIRREGRRPQ